ncbi:hypothetical protein DICPUDRAFT_99774 [Dictyostelium purpureum]|uniref:HECT-type E3 ubiquitin transferase n=1 Tax=Dictyostelium purpureum TaxID=5786 RepID=F1A2E9_DICPU|nr:uncharacterized protein DICPUDRAFT_99774 [Dictyostelium purpureum]EGC29639.1 hypothetical protein DICPUDRAFT_99774 [Dictyostelium purpureum]|eukprot:XP_003293843.1 hypothetical protein DICPUDRAFT_99774 [Dictyostelium purpureum]
MFNSTYRFYNLFKISNLMGEKGTSISCNNNNNIYHNIENNNNINFLWSFENIFISNKIKNYSDIVSISTYSNHNNSSSLNPNNPNINNYNNNNQIKNNNDIIKNNSSINLYNITLINQNIIFFLFIFLILITIIKLLKNMFNLNVFGLNNNNKNNIYHNNNNNISNSINSNNQMNLIINNLNSSSLLSQSININNNTPILPSLNNYNGNEGYLISRVKDNIKNLSNDKIGCGLNSIVSGNGISGEIGDVGDDFSFQVTSFHKNGLRKKQGGDVISVFIQGCDYNNMDEQVKVRIVDRLNGCHLVYYNVSKSGSYLISVFVNQVPVVNSPFKVSILPIPYSVHIKNESFNFINKYLSNSNSDNINSKDELNINNKSNIDNNSNNYNNSGVLEVGKQIVCEVSPTRVASHLINDKVDFQIFIKENGILKRTNINIQSEIITSNNSYQSHTSNGSSLQDFESTILCKFKLLKSGDYILEGSIAGIQVFSKNLTVSPGPVSNKFTHLFWDGKELISENKLFILKENDPENELPEFKFLIESKDSYGNKTTPNLNDFKYYLKKSLSPLILKNNNSNNANNNIKKPNNNSEESSNIPEESSSNSPQTIRRFNKKNIDSIKLKHKQIKSQQLQKQLEQTQQPPNDPQHQNYNINNDKDLIEIFPQTSISNDGKIVVKFNDLNEVGWYYFCVKVNDEPITNCPFVLATIKEKDFQALSNYYINFKASFNCQLERNGKPINVSLVLTQNKIEIFENYYFMNIKLYEFIINPTVQILLSNNENELIIQDNKSVVYLKSSIIDQVFLILLTSYYFFGYQCEPNFDSKVKWLKNTLSKIQKKMITLKINISTRKQILKESIQILGQIDPSDLNMSRLFVKFHDEEGIDIGGISKEWFSNFSEELARTPINGYYLFSEYEGTRKFHPSPFSNLIPDYKSIFRVLGRITGKSIIDSVTKADRHFSLRFTPVFYKLILGEKLSIDDLELIDPDLYNNKVKLILNTPMDQVNEILGEPLTFIREIYNQNEFNNISNKFKNNNNNNIHTIQLMKTINLKPFGNLISVNDENKVEYLELWVNSLLYSSIKSQVDEFREGLFQMIPQSILSVLNWKELEMLICGREQINLDDLKEHSSFTGFYTQSFINDFWSIVNEFNEEEKKSLIKFVTGSSSVPLGGFYQLCPHFTINLTPPIDNGTNRLPISHTCFNRLDIPLNCLSSKNLKLAINEGGDGFSLV